MRCVTLMVCVLGVVGRPSAHAQCEGRYSRAQSADATTDQFAWATEWRRGGSAIDAVLVGFATRIEGQPIGWIAELVDDSWRTLGGGLDGQVRSAAEFQGRLVIAGQFNRAGDHQIPKLAQWDGESWSALGEPPDGDVQRLVVFNGELFAFGAFSSIGGVSAGRVAIWNGSAWRAAGPGWTGNATYACSGEWNGLLVVGVSGTPTADPATTGLVAWDGAQWSSIGGGPPRGQARSVGSLVVHEGALVVSNAVGGSNYVHRWDGISWTEITGGSSLFTRVASFGGLLFYAGLGGLVVWDGQSTVLNPHGATGPVYSMVVDHGKLVIAGWFTGDRRFVACWDGTSWSDLGPGIDGEVNDLYAGAEQLLIVGSDVRASGGVIARGLSVLGANGWRELGGGVSGGEVSAMLSESDRLVVGGTFTRAGSTAAERVAQWDGAAWSTFGSGVDGQVFALGKWGDRLVAGGLFTHAGGAVANRVAVWSGTQWDAIGQGFGNGQVNALAEFNGELYAAGSFTNSGGVPMPGLARWSNNQWISVSPGNGTVRDLRVFGGDLYAAGSFNLQQAGGVGAWNGQAWRTLGAGIRYGTQAGTASVVSEIGSDLFVAGIFDSAGGLACSGGARWDGAHWSQVPRLNYSVKDSVNFAGTTFATHFVFSLDPFGRPRGYGRISRLDPSAWVEPWGEWNGSPACAAAFGGELIVAGGFTAADRGYTLHSGRWQHPHAPTVVNGSSRVAVRPGVEAVLTARVGGMPRPVVRWLRDGVEIDDGPAPGGGWLVGARTGELRILGVGTADSGLYQLRAENSCGSTVGSAQDLICCPADFNLDGFVDFFDFADFVDCFEGVACPGGDAAAADFNGDGFVDFFDFGAFVDAFELGC